MILDLSSLIIRKIEKQNFKNQKLINIIKKIQDFEKGKSMVKTVEEKTNEIAPAETVKVV